MQPKFSPIRLTVIDFMGVFLPGCIWAVLFATWSTLLGKPAISGDINPFNVAHQICLQLKDGGLFLYILAGVLVLILGYVAKALSLEVSERFVTTPSQLMRLGGRHSAGSTSAEYRFPYDALHREKPYYKRLSAAIEGRVGGELRELPGNGLFSAAKSMLHAYGDTSGLSEMVQYREAEVRMLSSLLLASIFSGVLAVVKLTVSPGASLAWLAVSSLLVVVMGSAFAARRRYEVISVYLYSLVALPLMGVGLPEKVEASTAVEATPEKTGNVD